MSTKKLDVKIKVIDSLTKVFDDQEPMEAPGGATFSGFRNEVISLQVAYSAEASGSALDYENYARVEIASDLEPLVKVRKVDLVANALPVFPESDDDYLGTAAGLYPDPLAELEDLPTGQFRIFPGRWRALWIDVEGTADRAPGTYPLLVRLRGLDGALLAEAKCSVEILDAKLPPQRLRRTHWLHCDCLADYYRLPVFSEAHWGVIEKFIGAAVRRGVNTIFTPLFTPPIDTKPGGERPTVQLVEVSVVNGDFTFGFSKLERWLELCGRLGVEYLELSHLYTQWGAKYAPKVMATVDGEQRRLFPWDTEGSAPRYSEFLRAFLQALLPVLKRHGYDRKAYFHISDEPALEHLETYRAAKAVVEPFLEGWEVIDALSSFEFYRSGVIAKPIPALDHIAPFLEAKVPGLWTYYCLAQYRQVPNSFIAMPSCRTRILGVLFYAFGIEGFLHWGYNFYYSQFSAKLVDPYADTTADGFGPGGDAFLVYPGKDGVPVESIRFMVLNQAMQDLRALQFLEELSDRSVVLGLIEEGLAQPLSFTEYPRSPDYILSLRRRVNDAILRRLGSPSRRGASAAR